MRIPRALTLSITVLVLLIAVCPRGRAQGALLMEDADGLSRILIPTGHTTIYFARICAASPTRLRLCASGELGVVLGRHGSISGYDWVAMPVLAYLYSVEGASQVPARINRVTEQSLRVHYHEAHLLVLGKNVPEGGGWAHGWRHLVGAAYDRRIYAFRFQTTEAQDDAFIAKMNADPNRTHFNLFWSNCADFTSGILNFYFPRAFRRSPVPDFGMTTPRQVGYELARYGRKHPEIQLTVMVIPQVPGDQSSSHLSKSGIETLISAGYVVPIGLLSPYAAGAIVADELLWGRCPLQLKHAEVLGPEKMARLASSVDVAQSQSSSPALPEVAAAR